MENNKKAKSRGKYFVLAIVVVLVVIIVFVLLNISVKEKEIKNVKESTTIQDTTIFNKETQWDVTWYSLTGDYKFGGVVGKSKFPSTFMYNWGFGKVYKDYSDYIGFIAKAYINAPRNGLFYFKIGSDDGIKLTLDGKTLLTNQWNYGGSYSTNLRNINLKKGKHYLVLKYYEKYKEAAVLFDCSPDLLTWKEKVINKRDTFIVKQETTTVKKKIINILLGK